MLVFEENSVFMQECFFERDVVFVGWILTGKSGCLLTFYNRGTL